MTIASGSRVQLVYVAETTHGTTPATPTMAILRSTTRNLNLTKATLASAEVRADRQKADLRHGMNKVEGGVGFELSRTSYDTILEALLGSTFATISVSGSPNLAAATGPDTFTRATGSFITDGLIPGDIITTAGFSNTGNNGTFIVTAVTATVLTVYAPAALTTETSGSGKTVTVTGKRLKVGTTLTTLSIERQFPDIGQFQLFAGCAINQMSLKIDPQSMIGGQFDIVGMSAAAITTSTAATTTTAAPTTSPLAAFDGYLIEGGSVIGIVTSLDVTVNNNRTLGSVVGSKFSPDVFEGQVDVTGTVGVYFKDAVMLNKFINETESGIIVKLNDINGTDFIGVSLPRIKYTGGTIDPPATGPIVLQMPFTALVPSTVLGGSCINIQHS